MDQITCLVAMIRFSFHLESFRCRSYLYVCTRWFTWLFSRSKFISWRQMPKMYLEIYINLQMHDTPRIVTKTRLKFIYSIDKYSMFSSTEIKKQNIIRNSRASRAESGSSRFGPCRKRFVKFQVGSGDVILTVVDVIYLFLFIYSTHSHLHTEHTI